MGIRQNGNRGYSILEVLIVIVLTTIGFLALVALQIGTLRAVGTGRSMMHATNLAEHFIESLKAEAVSWSSSQPLTDDATKFPRLRNALAGNQTGWLRGYASNGSDQRVGPLGNDLNPHTGEATLWNRGLLEEVVEARDRQYCLHYRLTWLVPDQLVRADVRVLWTRDNADSQLYSDCRVGANIEQDTANLGSITVPGTIMRNVFSK